MLKKLLKDGWHMSTKGRYSFEADTSVPCSLYSVLTEQGLIDDPYKGENEYKSTDISSCDTVFETTFDLEKEYLEADRLLLRFNGIDTSAQVYVNGVMVGSADNMYRTYTYDIKEYCEGKGNSLRVYINSPIEYINERQEKEPLWCPFHTMDGAPHIRKPIYMFGWDWGPKLPDMGIWRDVELLAVKGARITDLYIRQDHTGFEETGTVKLDMTTSIADNTKADRLAVTVTYPDGQESKMMQSVTGKEVKTTVMISEAELWYPNGYGRQPLYTVTAEIMDEEGNVYDSKSSRIGLRTVTVTQDTCGDGHFFGVVVNGTRIFSMGANYVPEDNIITRTPSAKTRKLLRLCKRANFNMLRVWGGGVYCSDEFYDLCDEMGLLVWQDFMFACAVYKADKEMISTIGHEVTQNVKRLRNHPCIALWCGNNEMESMWIGWNIDSPAKYKQDYLRIFEALIPSLLKKLDPDRFYHPSSPSTGGNFSYDESCVKGDQHYWAVWHSLKPFDEYLKKKFRFCSEFGFESMPSLKTIMSFAEKKDLNLMTPVMEAHQKGGEGNEKLLYYIAQMLHYPTSFEGLIYATQTVQSDAIRLNVEHMRRNRQICSGSLYWQVNDSNPVISWSSVDYFLRLKPLHYCARRFYSPVMLSAYEADGELHINISSERRNCFRAILEWNLRNASRAVVKGGKKTVEISPLHAKDYLVLSEEEMGLTDRRSQYAEFRLTNAASGKEIFSSAFMFVLPKSFSFEDPKLSMKVTEESDRFRISISSKAFAKGVFLEGKGEDFDPVFSDNFIDVHDTADIFLPKSQAQGLSAPQLLKKLRITSYYDAMGLSKLK